MKSITAILFILIFMLSCKKSQQGSPLSNNLVGKWRLNGEFGGFVGYLKFPPDYPYIYSFSPDGTYTISIKDSLVMTGSYSITPKTSIRTQKVENFINYNSNISAEYYQISADTLTFTGDYEGETIGSWYIRILH
jgi:hypothetical protein